MSVQEWFNSGCDYKKGVELYSRYGRNKNLLRRFQRIENAGTTSKLKYELQKILDAGKEEAKTKPKQAPNIVKRKPIATAPESTELRKLKSRPLSSYPVQLHPVYQLRLSTFMEACSLKIKLNSLKEEETEKAFDIQYRIFELFETNDKCWELLKHYEATGRIMPLTASEDYSKMSPAELFRTRENLYSRVSKRKKTIKKKEQELANTKDIGKQERLRQTIIGKKEELRQLENDIEAITELLK